MPLFVTLYLMSRKLEAHQASEPSGLKDETFLPTYLEGERRFGHGLNVNLVAGYCVNASPLCAVSGQMIRRFVPGW